MTRIWMTGLLLLLPSLLESQVRSAEVREVSLPAADVSPLHLMSPEKFVESGLTKLSHSELQVLAQWVRRHSLMVGQLAYGAAANNQSAQPTSSDVIETHLAGDFTGWDGSTVFQLANGQIWQQSSLGSLHRFERSPKVTLVATLGGWRMEVEGVSQTIFVRRIR